MNSFSRGIRNAFRNGIRTFSIVIILGLSVGLALSMLVAKQAVADKITSVKSSIGNTISVSPAGFRGFEGGGEPLTNDQLAKVATLSHVSSVLETLSDRVTSSNTSLQSSISLGSLGTRAENNSGIEFRSSFNNNSSGVTRTFTPPVTVTGVSNLNSNSTYGADSVSYVSGVAIDPSKDIDQAVLGKAIAEKNNLSVGSTFTLYGSAITVAGIYDTGNTFSNNGVIVPLLTLQRLSSQTNAVTSAIVTVDSVDNLASVTTAIKNTLGTAADVVNSQTEAENAIAPLESVKSIAEFSVAAAIVAGAVIILLTMTMIVRERRREIGVMKAIGSTNTKMVLQFVTESITLTLIGMLVGVAIAFLASQPLTQMLVSNSNSSTTSNVSTIGRPFRLAGQTNSTLRNIENIKTSISTSIFLEGVAAAFVIAIIGSAVPTYLLSKIRPAEVMRAE